MRATRAYLAGLGTAGTLVLAASILFVLGSAVVTYNGWPKLGGIGSPATQTLTAHPKPGSSHASQGVAAIRVVKPHAGAAGLPALIANKRSTLLAEASHGTASHRSAQHSTSATISHPVAGSAPTRGSTPTKTGSGSGGSGTSGSGASGSGGGTTTGTVPVVTTPTPVSATPSTPVSTGSGGSGSGGSGSGGSPSGNPGTPVVKTGSGTVVVTMPSSSGSRPTGTPVISTTGSSGSSSASGGSGYSSSSSSSTSTTSSSTTTPSSSTTTVTVSGAPTIPGGRGGVGGPTVR